MRELTAACLQPTATFVEASAYCKACRAGRNGPICSHCTAMKHIQEYELKLYRFRRTQSAHSGAYFDATTDASAPTTAGPGLLAATYKQSSEAEQALRAMAAYARGHCSAAVRKWVEAESQEHFSLLSQFKDELKHVLKTWHAQHQKLGLHA